MAKDNKSLFHYTDLNAIFGMVRQNGIHFRATQFSKLNDSHEFKWIYDDIKEELVTTQSSKIGYTYSKEG